MADTDSWVRMAAAITPGARVWRVRKLGGGLSGDVFAVDLEGAGHERVVVKQFRPHDDVAAEWECLDFAQRIPLPAPRGLALDAEGEWFGLPALVMTHIGGRLEVVPGDVDDWLHRLAHTMATIHETPIDGAPNAVRRAPDPETWHRPDFRDGPFVERAFAAVEAALPRAGWPPVLIHGDFHPCQVLWKRGAVSGVIDWGDLNVGPRWYEVAYCRADVTLLYGIRGADRLLEHYVAITGLEPVDLAAFDLMCGMKARQWGHMFLVAYEAAGRTDSVRQFAARLAPFNRRALAELSR